MITIIFSDRQRGSEVSIFTILGWFPFTCINPTHLLQNTFIMYASHMASCCFSIPQFPLENAVYSFMRE